MFCRLLFLDRFAIIKADQPVYERSVPLKKQISLILLLILAFSLTACGFSRSAPDIAATTLPVYQFTAALCEGTGLEVARLIQDSVSCLHDYTLQVDQMKTAQGAEVIVLSGLGLEDFLDDVLSGHEKTIDASEGITPLPSEEEGDDPHIWLSPDLAMVMAENICSGLCRYYPEYTDSFLRNREALLLRLQDLSLYGQESLSDLHCRQLVTFHDGFSYFADAFGLEILMAVEEESGAEASAEDLTTLIDLVKANSLPAIFTERNGSTSAARIVASETGISFYALDMAISGQDYFEAMYGNIDTIREALQ